MSLRLTGTGRLCCRLPWLLLFRPGVSFTLLEFSLFIACWGTSSGIMAVGVEEQAGKLWMCLPVLYTVLHTHFLLFTGAVYPVLYGRETSSSRRDTGSARRVFPQLVLTLGWGLLGGALAGWLA